MKCDDGFVLDTAHTVFGVISNEFKFFGHCTEESINNRIKEKDYQSCSRHMDSRVVKRIKQDLKDKCKF